MKGMLVLLFASVILAYFFGLALCRLLH